MKFSEIVKGTITLLQESGRMTYRALKLEFALNDEQLDVPKDELIEARELAVDKDGKMLVWTGHGAAAPQPACSQPRAQPPASYMPPTWWLSVPIPIT